MRIHESEGALRRHAIQQTGLEIEQLDAVTALTVMTTWYATERADDADALDDGGDMLLVQYWASRKQGDPTFAYDLTRQFITPHDADHADEAFWQLSMTLFFTGELSSSWPREGNDWCRHPSELDAFIRTVEDSAAAIAVRGLTPVRIEIDLGPAG